MSENAISGQQVLLPCPFCGSEAQIIREGDFVSVACTHYYCNFSQIALRNEKNAIDRWNTRVSAPPQGEPSNGAVVHLMDVGYHLDDIEVDADGNCKWTDVANALQHIKACRLPDYVSAAASPQKTVTTENRYEDRVTILQSDFESLMDDRLELEAIRASAAGACKHEAIIGLNGKWRCQKCATAIEVATAQICYPAANMKTDAPHLLDMRGIFKDCGEPPFKLDRAAQLNSPAGHANEDRSDG